MWGHTPVELFLRGGFAMWPLLASSILGLAVILDRSIVLLWLAMDFNAFTRWLEPLVRSGRLDEARRLLAAKRSPVAIVSALYLAKLDHPASLREEIVAREGSRQVARMEKRMSWLGMNASVATLLGLLGTVTGLVTAFHEIELKAGQVQPGDLAAGIWEALITTVFGLMIAIPCLAAYHMLDNRAGAVALQMQWITAYLDEWLHRAPGHKPSENRPDGPHLDRGVEVGIHVH
jgi:biopolymer transport protein ExbB